MTTGISQAGASQVDEIEPVLLPPFDTLVNDRLATLQPAARRVIRYIADNRLAFLSMSAAEIARRVGASDATVVRAVQALGYRSLAELRAALLAGITQDTTLATRMQRTAGDIGVDVGDAVAAIVRGHRESLDEIGKPEVQEQLVQAVRALNPCSRILIFGIGPSSGLADYIAILLRRHGRSACPIGTTGSELADRLIDLSPGDGLLLLAYQRTYPEIRLLFEEAERLRLPVVLVTDSLDPRLARRADVVVPAKRGRQGRVALHGATLVVLEAIVLGLAIANPTDAITSLARIGSIRDRLMGLERTRES